MALTERTEEDLIEIVGPYRQIQVRLATVIERDGVEISREFSRRTLAPDDDLLGESTFVTAVANAAWTLDVKTAWANRPQPDV